MLEQDITALKTRFYNDFVIADAQVIATNQPVDPAHDPNKPHVRFVVAPGASRRRTVGPSAIYTQLGRVILKVTVPQGTYDASAYALRDQFADLFRDWRSPDRKLVCGTIDNDQIEHGSDSSQPGSLELICSIAWRSDRQK